MVGSENKKRVLVEVDVAGENRQKGVVGYQDKNYKK